MTHSREAEEGSAVVVRVGVFKQSLDHGPGHNFCFLFSRCSFATLLLFNMYRISRIVRHLEKSRSRISTNDHKVLMQRYNGFLNYMEGFPNKSDYPQLYDVGHLDDFKR